MTILESSTISSTSSTSTPPISVGVTGMLMTAPSNERYITPEYLAPLPPTASEKTGKSPLQLLAQTCSQIGADTGSNRILAEKSGADKGSKNKSPALIVSDHKPVSFKPYENKTPSKPSSIVSLSPGSHHSASSPKMNGSNKSPSPVNATTKEKSGQSPVIRSGMEVLAGASHSKDLGSFRLPPTSSLDPSNPAFRPPFSGSSLSAYPPTSLASLTGSHSVCRDPYCRDPGCPTAMYNAQLAASLAAVAGMPGLPPGYLELLQAQKMSMGLQAAAAIASTSNSLRTTTTTTSSAGPYICNWVNGREGYCGKRHSSADELLQHLRTHTNLSTTDSAALLSSSLYPHGLAGASGLHRTYPGSAALSSLASSRFHPYGKPGGSLPSPLAPTLGLGALGMPPPLPHSLAGLSAYSPSSLYALYGSRLAGGSLP